MIMFFFLILFIEFLSIYLNGLMWFAVPAVLKNDSITVLIIASVIIYFLTGFLISLLKKHFFSIKSIKYAVTIIICSCLIIGSFLIAIGNFTIFDSVTEFFQQLWLIVFHVKKDPIGMLTIGIINLPIMFFVIPMSFYVGDYLFGRINNRASALK